MNEQLLQFWPTAEAIDECIGTQAETLDESVFLAVHQPMRLSRTAPSGEKQVDENEFLRRFLFEPPEGTSLFIVVGDSGIGKTHLIRWLGIQLANKKASGSLVIRIPRTASLRRVIELLIEDLKGPTYARIREQLGKAREQIDPNTAVMSFRGNFVASLINDSEEANQTIQALVQRGEQPSEELKFRKSLGSQKMLPALIDDPSLFDYFVGTEARPGILRRIASRAIAGPGDVYEHVRFEADHLAFRDVDMSGLSAPAKGCYDTISSAKNLKWAVDILNDRVDDAMRRLIASDPTELTDLFTEVRNELFKESRDLILLVEDFSVLTGLQRSLLDVMIQPGFRDGVQHLCTMRTVIAVTEGYWKTYETIETRSSRWKLEGIPGVGDEDAMASRVVDLVGAYLNAARIGKVRLSKEIAPASRTRKEAVVPSFIAELDDDVARMIDAFGRSNAGHPLFPFNPTAIRYLARHFATANDGGFLKNPRTIINAIIRPTIRSYRDAFARGEFPPTEFLDIPRIKIHSHFSDRRYQGIRGNTPSGEMADRTLTALSIWGGEGTTDETSAGIGEVFEAFGLELPNRPDGGVTVRRVPEHAMIRRDEPERPDWGRKLTNWAVDHGMSARDANDLRRNIATCVASAIDWDRELIKRIDITDTSYRNLIYLAGISVGNPPSEGEAVLVACSQTEFDEADRRTELRAIFGAIMRHSESGTWKYPGADSDYPLYATYVERKAKEVVTFLRQHYLRARGDILPQLVGALYASGLALGVEGADGKDEEQVINALLESREDAVWSPQISGTWDGLQAVSARVRARADDSPLSLLLMQTGARQSEGGKVHAVDCARILEEVARFRKKWPAISMNTNVGDQRLCSAGNRVNSFFDELERVVNREKKELVEWSQTTSSRFGLDAHPASDVAIAMRAAIDAGEPHYSGSLDTTTLRQMIDGFLGANLRDLVKLPRILETSDRASLIGALARVDRNLKRNVERLLGDISKFLDDMEPKVADLRRGSAPELLNATIQTVANDLSAIKMALTSLTEEMS